MKSQEEKLLYSSIENGEWQEVENFGSLKRTLEQAAAETSSKDYRMNVRISKRDVDALKTQALIDGLPYQTLVTSILHKYVTGVLVENSKAKVQ